MEENLKARSVILVLLVTMDFAAVHLFLVYFSLPVLAQS